MVVANLVLACQLLEDPQWTKDWIYHHQGTNEWCIYHLEEFLFEAVVWIPKNKGQLGVQLCKNLRDTFYIINWSILSILTHFWRVHTILLPPGRSGGREVMCPPLPPLKYATGTNIVYKFIIFTIRYQKLRSIQITHESRPNPNPHSGATRRENCCEAAKNLAWKRNLCRKMQKMTRKILQKWALFHQKQSNWRAVWHSA